jgi:hypothetical protein
MWLDNVAGEPGFGAWRLAAPVEQLATDLLISMRERQKWTGAQKSSRRRWRSVGLV